MAKRLPGESPYYHGTLAELRVMRALGHEVHSRKHPSLHQLLVHVAKNPTHAARVLEKLEARWKRILFNRRTLRLTPDGERAYQFADRVLHAHEQGPFAQRRETLRIGTSNRVMTTFLAPKIRTFLSEVPRGKDRIDVDLELMESTRENLIAALENNDIDCAIFGAIDEVVPRTLNRYLISQKHATVLIAAKTGCGAFDAKLLADGYQVRISELSRADVCVIRSDTQGPLKHLPPPHNGYCRIVVENYASVVSVVQSGIAVGLVIDMGLSDDLLRFELHPEDGVESRDVAVWTRADRELGPIARRFMSVVLGQRVPEPTPPPVENAVPVQN